MVGDYFCGLLGSTTTTPIGDMCFDSPRSSRGVCDPSTTGLQMSGLSPSAPFVSNIASDVNELQTATVETGSFEFTPESGGLCQEGTWKWTRVTHEQVITLSVATRFVTVRWHVGGALIGANAGKLSLSALCRWPFPLPQGRVQNRLVNVKYQVTSERNRSTLRLFNDPADGCYSVPIQMTALVDDREHASSAISALFNGETCDFDPEQVRQQRECIRKLIDRQQEKPKFRRPVPGEPVVAFAEELWSSQMGGSRKEATAMLLDILANSLHDDPETFTRAITQLERETGIAGVARLVTIGPAEQRQRLVLQQRE